MSFETSWHASRINHQALRKMKFLDQMDKVIPWDKLVREIEQKRKKHRRVRYRGIEKNWMQRYMLADLSNLYMMRKKLVTS